MAKPDKAATVAELRDKFTNSSGAFLTEYRGLSVKALKDLRVSLGQNASYSVSKNTLTTIAAGEAGIDGLDEQLVGPTAIAFIDGDPVVVAKGLRDFARTNPLLVIKGGFLEGKVLGPDEVRKLADLESRETLLARVAGGMQGVLSQAISLISAPLSQAARLFGALQSAAEENPSLIGGRGTPTEDPATTTEAAPAPSPSAENDEASASEVAGSSAATDEASAATAPTITEAAPAAPTNEAAPAAPTTEAAPAADNE
jgi:large subunit ribosomal protein L10